jgi:hypothetical protein
MISRIERLRRQRDEQRAIRDAALAQAAAAREQIARIDEEIEAARRPRIAEPESNAMGRPPVVYFQKKYGSRVYDYAAIKAGSWWYITQDGHNPLARQAPMDWGALLEFAGDSPIHKAIFAPRSLQEQHPMSSGGYV